MNIIVFILRIVDICVFGNFKGFVFFRYGKLNNFLYFMYLFFFIIDRSLKFFDFLEF